MRLTRKETIRARGLLNGGQDIDTIAAILGRDATARDVTRALEADREMRKAQRAVYGDRGQGWVRIIVPQESPAPKNVIDEWIDRMSAPWRGITGYILGDPRYGYSELDKRPRRVVSRVRDPLEHVICTLKPASTERIAA